MSFLFSVLLWMCFLLELWDKGRILSTFKVYLACHVWIDRNTTGQHPLICRFMREVCGVCTGFQSH